MRGFFWKAAADKATRQCFDFFPFDGRGKQYTFHYNEEKTGDQREKTPRRWTKTAALNLDWDSSIIASF